MQLYFYDSDESISHQVKRSPNLDVSLIRKILSILDGNPYVRMFRCLGTITSIEECTIKLNTCISIDQRR
jgi:hypothetical protein